MPGPAWTRLYPRLSSARACERASVRACERASVRACERASVREKQNKTKNTNILDKHTSRQVFGGRSVGDGPKPVEFDALVPFMKVWRSNSAS